MDILCLSRRTDTSVLKNTPVKVEVPIRLLYSSKSEKLQTLKCTLGKKVNVAPRRTFVPPIFVQS